MQAMDEFRFKTKTEYERALENVLLSGKKVKKKKSQVDPEKEYEDLVEEYLRFCSLENNGE